MSTEQNKVTNEKNNDTNNIIINQSDILKQEKEEIISLTEKDKEKKINEKLNSSEEQHIKKDVLKTEKEEKFNEKNNSNVDGEKDINLINDDKNINLIDEKNSTDNKNCNLIIEENPDRNKNIITENKENLNNTQKNIDINITKENQKEEIKAQPENNINKNLNENNINNNINNKVEKEEKEEKEKHKLNYNCLNECTKWILNIEIKNKSQPQYPIDFKSQYEFQGSSIFFKKLEQSLINGLHNPQNLISSHYKNMPYKLILDSIKTESNKRLELINQSSLEQNNSLKELINYSFPIDNSKSNYFFINTNLSMKENLNNIFLIEFDLENINTNDNLSNNKEEQDFRKINDFCVERELDFKLNGYFHEKKIFKNDLIFSAGYRDFIKSIQFQIKSKIQKNKILSQNLFFAKVLNNANLGIEFFMPSLTENSQTNFNAIVNSHSEIKKIFLELTIPNNIFTNSKANSSNIIEGITEDSNSISTKRTEINSPKKEEIDVNNSNSNQNSNKNLNYNINNKHNFVQNINNNNLPENPRNYLFNSNISSPNIPNINPPNLLINRGIPLSPHLNNYQQYLFQQKYSPLINPQFNNNNMNFNLIPNNFRPIPNRNSFYSATPNYPLSPLPPQPQQIFGSPQSNINNINSINTFSPLSASLMMMKMPNQGRIIQPQPLSMNSPFNTSNYSSPYLGQNVNGNTTSLNSSNIRKNSESFQNDNKLNSNLNRKIYNKNQHHTPCMMSGRDEEFLNKFMSPKSMGPSTSFNLGNNANLVNLNLNVNKINGSMYQLNPMNNINQMKQQMNQMGNINQIGNVIPMTIRQKIFEKRKKDEVDRINKLLNTMNRIRPNNNNININNMNNVNNFNSSSSNNTIRTNIIKNNLIPNIQNIQNIPNINMNNMNNPNNINNFNNISANKNMQNIQNIQNMQNIHNLQNNNIPNMINMNNNINLNMNNMSNMNRVNNNINCQMNLNHENVELNEKRKIQNLFIIENQNKTNLDLFLKSVTPIYKITKDNDFSKLKIHTIFNNMKLISLLGLKTIYYNNGELLDIWYSLSFSSFFIKIINKQLITKIFNEIKNKKKDLENIILNPNEEIKIIESLFTLYFTSEYLEISFTETKPEYSRKNYNSIIKLIKNSIPFFEQISIEDIDINKSFFALLFSSVKILKPYTPHSLVVYYNFNNEGIISNNEKYFKQCILGILPIKVNNEFFLQKIIFKQQMQMQMQTFRFYNQDNLSLFNMSYTIINKIKEYTRNTSYDYELFIKMKNFNYNKQ